MTASASELWTRETLSSHLEAELILQPGSIGTFLPSERTLCEQYGVSRPFLREVLSGLAQRGLLEMLPGRGTRVRGVTSHDVARMVRGSLSARDATPRQMIEARATLEVQCVTLAAERASRDDLAAIRAALVQFDRAVDIAGEAKADIAFHALIVRAAGNPVLELMFGAVAPLVFEIMLRSLRDPETRRGGVPLHQRIADAIGDRDPVTAAALMTEHLHLAESTYGPDLDRSLEELSAEGVGQELGGQSAVADLVRNALATVGLNEARR